MERASLALADYADNSDEKTREVAEMMRKAISLYLLANQEALKLFSSDKNFSDQMRVESVAGKISADRKIAISLLSEASTYLIYVLLEFSKTENPQGPIPWKISTEERSKLQIRIGELFGDDLQAYRAWAKDSEQRLKSGKTSEFRNGWIMVAIDHIDSTLRKDNY